MKPVKEKCPECGEILWLSLVMKAEQIGDFSLAGNFVKFPVRQVPILECQKNSCHWQAYGEIQDGEAVFRRLW